MANYVLLERIELNASTTSVTFANIPQTGYTDLKIVISARTNKTGQVDDYVKIAFNGVSTNQTARILYGTGSAAGSTTDTAIYGPIDAAATASTFSNTEFYIPNYTSTTAAKSVSVDSVLENNATTATSYLTAGLWNPGTQASITTIALTPYYGPNFVSGSTFSLYGIAAVGSTPAIAPKASGGNIYTDGTYWYHAFLSSGIFTPATPLTCDYLVVGGGGGGGTSYGGGGGGGGLQQFTSQVLLANNNYVTTVGAGSAGGGINTNGSPSQFGSSNISYGGGHGGHNAGQNGQNGASGGGGGAGGGLGTGGSAIYGAQGNNGGNAISLHSGGGGGAGTAGAQGGGNIGGAGGRGITTSISGGSITGLGVLYSGSYYFAAGGAGVYTGGISPTPTFGVVATGSNAPANSGAGAAENSSGGSGVIIIRYPI